MCKIEGFGAFSLFFFPEKADQPKAAFSNKMGGGGGPKLALVWPILIDAVVVVFDLL